jgi:hypothetical protein
MNPILRETLRDLCKESVMSRLNPGRITNPAVRMAILGEGRKRPETASPRLQNWDNLTEDLYGLEGDARGLYGKVPKDLTGKIRDYQRGCVTGYRGGNIAIMAQDRVCESLTCQRCIARRKQMAQQPIREEELVA